VAKQVIGFHIQRNQFDITMKWPLKPSPIPISETPTWALYYQAACPAPSDPTMIWGTDVPTSKLDEFIRQANAQNDVVITPAHVLIWVVGQCLALHPEFNRRILHRRLYEFKQVNILMPVQGGKHGPEVCLITEVDQKPLSKIARDLWRHSRDLIKGTSDSQRDERIFRAIPAPFRGFLFRLMLAGTNWINWPAALWGHRTLRAGTMINYLGQRGAPPMRFFKASRFPNDTATLNVTMGPSQTDGENEPAAPLFVRADHRVVDAYQLGQFVADLRQYLADPLSLEESIRGLDAISGENGNDGMPVQAELLRFAG
jgi:hypothetical protein